ncbi:MAG: efflux RND transporter permease subunit [Candidatus Eisenbacteria bacterium]|nr:efflux RND transporter permease subunit [Candidatus Eisenbacteria bacterium]
MRLTDGSIKRPVTVSMVVVAVTVFGLVSLGRLRVELLPNITYPSLTIQTEYPDAAPAEVEQFVTRPIEEAVGVLPGLERVKSVSRPGQSEVTLEYVWKTKMDIAALDVREKLDPVELPTSAEKPIILRFDPSLDPIMRLRIAGPMNLLRLRRVAEKLVKKELESLKGVAAAKVSGGLEEEIHIEIDKGRLSELGIPITEVTARLAGENVNVAGGSLTDQESEFLVRTTNEFRSVDEIGDVCVGYSQGRPILARDVAKVEAGHKEQGTITRLNGQESVEVAIYKEGDANTVSVAKAVRQKLRGLSLPADVKATVASDHSVFIQQSVNEVMNSALLGGLLAILVLFLFLKDLRTTITIGLSIPVSVIATFVIMYRMGLSLNIMSLGGLALGVGMLVDNAIVVLEAVFRHKQRDSDLERATSTGAGEVSRAVIASTLTTVAVFVPLVFVEGIAGQLFRDQAITISASLLASLVAALTLVPMLSAITIKEGGRLASPSNDQKNRLGRLLGRTELRLPRTPVRLNRQGWLPSRSQHSADAENWRFHLFRSLYTPLARFGSAVIATPARFVGRLLHLVFVGFLWRTVCVTAGNILRKLTLGVLWPYVGRPVTGFLSRFFRILGRALVRVVRFVGRPAGRVLRLVLSRLILFIMNQFDRMMERVYAWYPGAARWSLKRRRRVILAAAGVLAVALLLSLRLNIELIPPVSQGEFTFNLRFPEGTSLQSTDRVVAEIEKQAMALPSVETVFSNSGSTLMGQSTARIKEENIAQVSVTLNRKGNPETEEATIERMRRILDRVPALTYDVTRPSYFSFRTPIEVEVAGYDIQTLRALSSEVEQRLSRIPSIRDIRSTMKAGNPEVHIVLDRERMASLNVDPAQAFRALTNAVRGDVATKFRREEDKIDVLVRNSDEVRRSMEELPNLVVGHNSGTPIPLSSIGRIVTEEGPAEITRVSQQRTAIVTANLTGHDLGGAASEIRDALRRVSMPEDFSAALSGQSNELSVSFRSLRFALLLAVFLVYLVMASQFESFLHPFVIMFTLPLAAIGVVFTLLLTGTSVSVMVLIGVIILAGIVVNNAIVLIDYTNQLRRKGTPKLEALVQAGSVRMRPILMTTFTTVLGLIPMAVAGGEGAELRAPLAITVIGGLVFGTALTLFVIPAVYAVIDRRD